MSGKRVTMPKSISLHDLAQHIAVRTRADREAIQAFLLSMECAVSGLTFHRPRVRLLVVIIDQKVHIVLAEQRDSDEVKKARKLLPRDARLPILQRFYRSLAREAIAPVSV